MVWWVGGEGSNRLGFVKVEGGGTRRGAVAVPHNRKEAGGRVCHTSGFASPERAR